MYSCVVHSPSLCPSFSVTFVSWMFLYSSTNATVCASPISVEVLLLRDVKHPLSTNPSVSPQTNRKFLDVKIYRNFAWASCNKTNLSTLFIRLLDLKFEQKIQISDGKKPHLPASETLTAVSCDLQYWKNRLQTTFWACKNWSAAPRQRPLKLTQHADDRATRTRQD